METSPENPPAAESTTAIESTRDQLKLLGVFYILLGILALPTLLVLAFHGPILDGLLETTSDPELVESIKKIVNTSIVGFVILILVHVLVCFYIGVCFRKQRHHTLCIIAAAFCCLSFPLGTILGVFSLIVLLKPEAKQLFGIAVQPQ